MLADVARAAAAAGDLEPGARQAEAGPAITDPYRQAEALADAGQAAAAAGDLDRAEAWPGDLVAAEAWTGPRRSPGPPRPAGGGAGDG